MCTFAWLLLTGWLCYLLSWQGVSRLWINSHKYCLLIYRNKISQWRHGIWKNSAKQSLVLLLLFSTQKAAGSRHGQNYRAKGGQRNVIEGQGSRRNKRLSEHLYLPFSILFPFPLFDIESKVLLIQLHHSYKDI